MRKESIFYLCVSIVFIAILYSYPFLRYPYDMIHHLIVIDNFYMKLTHPIEKVVGIWANDIYYMIPNGMIESIELGRPRYLWHYMWAYVFYLFDIDSTQMFLRAKIIHVVQTFISLGAVYYFSKVVIRNTFKKIDVVTIQWLSLWSVVIWITIFATFSAAYHQVWMIWYSINYQITLPLFWYMLGLTLVLVLEETSWRIKLFFTMQILLFSRFILQIHSMEFLYYLMHLSVFSLIFIDKIYYFLKKYFYLLIPMIIAIVYSTKHYQPEHSAILNYLSIEKLPELYNKMMQSGLWLINGYNRASASINELMYITLYLGMFFILYLLWNRHKQVTNNINTRVLLFILIGSLFALIPLYQFSGGLFSIITRANVVNRFYYSSTLFVIIPISIYAIFSHYKLRYINLCILFILISVAVFSKYSNLLHHNYYKNIQSVQNSFQERKIGFNLSKKQIQTIKEKFLFYEQNNHTHKAIKFYARADIAFVIKYMYKKNVDWEGRYGGMNYKNNYELNKNNPSFKHILFEIPKDFPPFIPYK